MNATKKIYEAPVVRAAGALVEETRVKQLGRAEPDNPTLGQFGAADIGFGL